MICAGQGLELQVLLFRIELKSQRKSFVTQFFALLCFVYGDSAFAVSFSSAQRCALNTRSISVHPNLRDGDAFHFDVC